MDYFDYVIVIIERKREKEESLGNYRLARRIRNLISWSFDANYTFESL